MPAAARATLLIARHARAQAAQPGERDFDRALDATGRLDASAMAKRLVEEGWALGHVVASPASRCRETAAALAAPQPPLSLRHEERLYSGGVQDYQAVIDAADAAQSLSLVGHNPSVEQLAHHLLGEAEAMRHLPNGFPPGGVLCLARGGGPGQRAQFIGFLQP